jgi:hypothetical protein
MPRKIRAVSSRTCFASPLVFIAAVAFGCGSADDDPAQLGDAARSLGGAGGSGAGAAVGGAAAVNPLGRARCQPPAGVSGYPRTTQEALDLLNALPKPTSVACFVESLDRPLTVYASSSAFSAQPALSAVSPRLFLKLDNLWLSVVIDGDSSYLIEFGYQISAEPARSIKGELELPIDQAVPPSAPYDRVRYGGGTVCGLCHYDEQAAGDSSALSAFSSIAFRPRADSRVSIDSLRTAAASCDWQSQPHRCEMLAAVFDGGAVIEVPFPDTMSTFF